jgi:thiol-disulfide isomerase/thioredoxin
MRLPTALLALLLAFTATARADDRPPVGSTPPDVFGNDRDCDPVRLGDHAGKVVIITFWASWCGPCLRELPVLDKIRRTVGGEHLEVIAVNFGESRQDFTRIVRGLPGSPITWVHDRRGKASERYGVKALPNMFILDREGRITARHIGYGEGSIKDIVDEIIALLPPEALSRPAGS